MPLPVVNEPQSARANATALPEVQLLPAVTAGPEPPPRQPPMLPRPAPTFSYFPGPRARRLRLQSRFRLLVQSRLQLQLPWRLRPANPIRRRIPISNANRKPSVWKPVLGNRPGSVSTSPAGLS